MEPGPHGGAEGAADDADGGNGGRGQQKGNPSPQTGAFAIGNVAHRRSKNQTESAWQRHHQQPGDHVRGVEVFENQGNQRPEGPFLDHPGEVPPEEPGEDRNQSRPGVGEGANAPGSGSAGVCGRIRRRGQGVHGERGKLWRVAALIQMKNLAGF